jgi:hypothetical protein
MGVFIIARAWRSVALAFGLICFGPAASLNAGTLISPGTFNMMRKSAEPFGLLAIKLSAGGLNDKWNGVERKLAGRPAIPCHRGQRQNPRWPRPLW